MTANKGVQRTRHNVSGPLTRDVQQMSGGPQNPNAPAEG